MVRLKGMQWAKNRQSGFTIVELLIVIVVIAILAVITIVSYNGIRQRAAESVSQNAVSQAIKALETYAVTHNEQYPDDLSAVGVKNDDSVEFWYKASETTPRTFCVMATVRGASYYQNNTGQANPTKGVCEGYQDGGTTPEPEPEPQPLVCETNFLKVPGNPLYGTTDFCVMKYEAKKGAGNIPVSKADTTPWVSISQTNAIAYSLVACDGCRLISEAEWLTIATNIASVTGNWSGRAIGSGSIAVGHSDLNPSGPLAASTSDTNAAGYTGTNETSGNQRRTLKLSTGDTIWDFAGNVQEFTSAQPTGGQPGITGGGFTAREWNSLTVTGTMNPNPLPSYGTPAAANWTSAHGIGQAYTSAVDTAQRAVVRGGAYNSGALASGIFGASMSPYPASSSNPAYGFRVTHQ